MKIRNGFVSNSSSSSFCIITKDENEMKEIINFLTDLIEEYINSDDNPNIDYNIFKNVIFGQFANHMDYITNLRERFPEIKMETFDGFPDY